MDKEEFAEKHGFESYESMLIDSTSVIFDHGITYYATHTPEGWLGWVDRYLDQPLGWFQTFESAQKFILDAFEEVSIDPEEVKRYIPS